MSKIQVADDDPDILALVTETLRHAGLDVTEVPDGFQALTEIRSMAYDLVVLDNMMPIMTGLEVLAASRDLPEDERPWILMLSALATRKDIRLGYVAGADDYMAKPFSTRSLLERVQQLLDERELFAPRQV